MDQTRTKVERISPDVARKHGRTAYDVQHYVPSAAARQKIEALAGRPQTQARDLFDLALLEARGAVDDELLASIDPEVRERASAALSSLTYADWEGQALYISLRRGRRFRSLPGLDLRPVTKRRFMGLLVGSVRERFEGMWRQTRARAGAGRP